jgi:four helix bundle protein
MDQKRNYKDLVVWQRAIRLVPQVYAVVKTLPPEERFDLGSQMRRAVVSVPANIAEGQARHSPKEFLHHLSIAKGSLAEVHTLLIVAKELNYLNQTQLTTLEAAVDEVAKPLFGLMSSLRG